MGGATVQQDIFPVSLAETSLKGTQPHLYPGEHTLLYRAQPAQRSWPPVAGASPIP